LPAQACPRARTRDATADVEPGRFGDMVVTALDELSEELGRLMRNVAVTV
jgi:predicted Zn-dependent protease with MMP-like domain